MFKRFMIGFAIGIGCMYYYLNNAGQTVDSAKEWGSKAASGYRGDQHRSLADEVLEKKKQER